MQIAERIRQYRKSRGLSLPAFARTAGVGDNTVVLIERYGILPKRTDVRERIARAMGLEYDQLWNIQGGDTR